MTDQDEIKAQHDSIRDRTAFETLPPMKVVKRIGQINKIGPGVQLPVTNANDYTWLEAPSRAPTTAFNLIERVENNHANYFGLNRVTVPQIKSQLMQQQLVNRWLTAWAKIYNQIIEGQQQDTARRVEAENRAGVLEDALMSLLADGSAEN